MSNTAGAARPRRVVVCAGAIEVVDASVPEPAADRVVSGSPLRM